MLLALCVWADRFVADSVLVLGDNTAALADALNLRGRGVLVALARELSWRKAKRRWQFEVAHLPAEFNLVADALSRTADPKGASWPAIALGSATFVAPPKLQACQQVEALPLHHACRPKVGHFIV